MFKRENVAFIYIVVVGGGIVCLVVLWLINLLGFFNAKAILLEEQSWYYLTYSWQYKGVHTFPKGVCLKVNIIA